MRNKKIDNRKREVSPYTSKELVQAGYKKIGSFANDNYLSLYAARKLVADNVIDGEIAKDNNIFYVKPGTTINISGYEKIILERDANLHMFRVREGLKEFRMKAHLVEEMFEEYQVLHLQGEDVELFYNPKKRVHIVCNSMDLLNKDEFFDITSSIIAQQKPVTSLTIKNEIKWVTLQYIYNSYRAFFTTKEGQEHKNSFDTLEEALGFFKEYSSKEECTNMRIRHHGYLLGTYKDGVYTVVDEESKYLEHLREMKRRGQIMDDVNKMLIR